MSFPEIKQRGINLINQLGWLIFLSLITMSCQKKRNLELSSNQLLQLMGGELFEITVPNDVTTNDLAGLAIRKSDGSIHSLGSSAPWIPGDEVKIICFWPQEENFKWAYFKKNGSGKGSSQNFPVYKMFQANEKRTGLGEGDYMMRFSEDYTIVGTGELTSKFSPDDFEIIFHVTRIR